MVETELFGIKANNNPVRGNFEMLKIRILVSIIIIIMAGHVMAAMTIPETVLTSVNMNANDEQGSQGRSLIVTDIEKNIMWNFPFASMRNLSDDKQATMGQPMHTALHPNKQRVYISMGGTNELPLRLLAIDLNWSNGKPTPVIKDSFSLVPKGNLNGTGEKQEAHGLRLTKNGGLLLFSELNNSRVRVFNTHTNTFVGKPTSHETIKTPHGVWPNPNETLAAIPQYEFDGNKMSIWNLDTDGHLSFNKSISLLQGDKGGAYTHTVVWLDNFRFYTSATQEKHQGTIGLSEQSVWMVDVRTDQATMVIAAANTHSPTTGLLEGVSDIVVANKKLYACEGNVEEKDSLGFISVWDISDTQIKPTFLKRFSAGHGLPSSFKNCHGLVVTKNENWVIAQSFATNHMIRINARQDLVEKIWDGLYGLDMPHGHYVQ